jgi:predicted metal-dependent peptidase
MSQIDIRMIKARSALIMAHPFFGALAMRLIVAERSDIRTLATDGKFLYYCRAFLDRVSEVELLFTVAHEVLHCALSHMTRRNGRRWDLWQAATDYVVNWMLHEAGFKVPGWVKYFDPTYAGLNVEEVYRILENKQKQQEQDQPQASGNGDKEPKWEPDAETEETEDEKTEADNTENPNDKHGKDSDDEADANEDEESKDNEPSDDSSLGSNSDPGSPSDDSTEPGNGADEAADGEGTQEAQGSGGHSNQTGQGIKALAPSYGDPGGCGEVLDAAPPHDTDTLDNVAGEWQVYTRQAANIARRAGEGKVPGFIEEIVEELNSPQTDWRDVLRRFVDPMTSTKDYSWVRPNVRLMSLGYFTPGLISDGINHVVLSIDSSYSIDSDWLRQFGGESQAALDDGAIDKVTVIFADTGVRKVDEYSKGEIIDFTVPGRGGTNFSPTFDWINENLTDVSAVIYFTDLDCTDFGPEPAYPVLWAAYDTNPIAIKQRMDNVPFGEVIELKM